MDEGFQGMSAFLRELRALPEQLRQEAEAVVRQAPAEMMAEIDAVYAQHEVTGTLRRHTRLESDGPLHYRVINNARHVHLFERGSVARYTDAGAYRGRMPARPTFIPAAQKARTRMIARLIDLVRRAKVRGMTGMMEVRER